MNPFLRPYTHIIFDLDGVITSEQNYWDSAALAVHEMLVGYNEGMYADRKAIRAAVLDNDRLIRLLKDRGVNSNWDLAYVIYCLRLRCDNGAAVTQYLSKTQGQAFQLYEFCGDMAAEILGKPREYCARGGTLWLQMQTIFQEWYLGESFEKQWGMRPANVKRGLCGDERPIIPLEALRKLLFELKAARKVLGIGTGRGRYEGESPLREWDVLKYFDPYACVYYDDLTYAEQLVGGDLKLTKPHPYTFLKAILGRDYPDISVINGEYDRELCQTALVVGDAGADILAAKSMGAAFAAVLTGIAGQDARRYFEEMGADYIVNTLEDFGG